MSGETLTQEALESANRTVLPGTMRTTRATVRLLELRERLLSEPVELCKRMVSSLQHRSMQLDHYSTWTP
jgi:hypothetical protein